MSVVPHINPSRPVGGQRIGPGRLVLVVGPSGAGKDTLIAHARDQCGSNPNIVFPRRIVTRDASSAEDNEAVSPDAFERMLAADSFALWWRAHGLSYAFPRSIDDDIGSGRTIVCNVSRTIASPARERYAHVAVVLVTAPVEILAMRLAQRGREPAAAIADRLRRSESLDHGRTDFSIENSSLPETAAAALVDIIYGRRA